MEKKLDVEKWERKSAYEFFKDFEDPFFNLTANLEVTALYRFTKENNLAFSLAALFYILQTANEIREFKLRFKDETLIEFEKIHATHTIIDQDNSFSFCYFEFKKNVFEFDEAGCAAVEKYKRLKTFDVETERLDLIYCSVIPWISFTSFKHATRAGNRQSVPRVVFGKVFEAGAEKLMPLSVEVHHALMDGFHVGRFFNSLQEKIRSL